MTRIRAVGGAALLALALLLPGQEPGSRPQDFVVRAGEPGVAEAQLDAVRDAMRQALVVLAPAFPGVTPWPCTVVVHRREDSLGPELRAILHPGTPGFALLERDEIHLVLGLIPGRAPNDLATVARHELVHVLLHRFAGPSGPYVPRWLHEGLAQVLAGAVYLGGSEDAIVFRVAMGQLRSFRDLEQGFPSDDEYALQTSYAQSFSLVSFLRRELGPERLLDLVRDLGPDTDFARAVYHRTGRPLLDLHEAWRAHLLGASGAVPRLLLDQCFVLALVLAFPLVVLAVLRRRRREATVRARLERGERIGAAEPVSPDAMDQDVAHPGDPPGR